MAEAHGGGFGDGGVDADAAAPKLVGGFVGVESGEGADLGAAHALVAELEPRVAALGAYDYAVHCCVHSTVRLLSCVFTVKKLNGSLVATEAEG